MTRAQWSLDLEKKYGITCTHTHQGVYAIRAKDTDEVLYVGSTCDLYQRCSEYFSKSKQDEEHLGSLWCKEHMGEWYFDVLLIRDDIGRKELREYEREFQLNYKPVLCKCYGDDALSGERVSERTRAKISAANRGKHLSEETRAKISAANRGKHHSEEARAKMSAANSGENHPMYGKHHSEETRAKMSAALSGENNPMKGKHHSEEARAKMSEALRGENHPRSKPVCCEELKIVFSSAGEAARWLRENGRPKADTANILTCCNAERKTAYGYHWRFD